MNTVEYDDSDFVVTSKEKDYGDAVGKFRVIRYNTGYYALQAYISDNPEDPSHFQWETVCVAPQLDTPLENGYDWKFSQGRLNMNTLLQHLENSSKLYNNELMELHLNLNKNLDSQVNEDIIEIIESEDGRKIADKIIESLTLQDIFVEEYLTRRYKKDMIFTILLISISVICFILVIGGIFKLW